MNLHLTLEVISMNLQVDRWQARFFLQYMVVLVHLVQIYRLCILLDLSRWKIGSDGHGLLHLPCGM